MLRLLLVVVRMLDQRESTHGAKDVLAAHVAKVFVDSKSLYESGEREPFRVVTLAQFAIRIAKASEAVSLCVVAAEMLVPLLGAVTASYSADSQRVTPRARGEI